MRKKKNVWSVFRKQTNFRDMIEGVDFVFTDAQIKNALVDVLCITYNHAPYIRQALDSVLMQKTQYPYRVVIADDGSTDGTSEIVREYQEKYPDRVATLLWKHNVGAKCNCIMTERLAKAEYVASLECDDYWTDPYKLEKSISFLEKHPEFFAFAHNISIVDEYGRMIHGKDPAYVTICAKEEHVYPRDNIKNMKLWRMLYISHSSAIINRNYQVKWTEDMWDAEAECREFGDVLRTLCLTCEGDTYFSRDIMSSYRRVFHGLTYSAQSDGKNVNGDLYFRRIDLDRFCQRVYGREISCLDAMLENFQIGSAEELLSNPTLRNFTIFAQVYLAQWKRTHWRRIK